MFTALGKLTYIYS